MEKTAERFAPMFMHMCATLGALSKAFYERYGEEALPIIARVAANYGVGIARIIQKMGPVRNMKDLGEILKMWETMRFASELIELTNNTIHFKVPKCPLGLEGTTRELCEAMMSSDSKMVSTLLEQEVEAKILKSIAAGDKYCEVKYSTK